eukprot:TRINITY_DN6229_c0_g1_i1.p1 TRINITY_DN6229_c0_g1~~TRINITY_DN6229_c0_g1_i1.p1  ORF type:complete len:206 (-),score=73.07 TRINITY_DN6229_c0_g1_i1:99-716(-)
MESVASSLDSIHDSPPGHHRRPRRFSNNSSNRASNGLINNKAEEEIIKGEASIVFYKDGPRFHGIFQGRQSGGLCQILGELSHSSSHPSELFSSSYDDEDESSLLLPSLYSTEVFQNHFESNILDNVEVLRGRDTCLIGSPDSKINFTSSSAHRGVNADKRIRSILGTSFMEPGAVVYSGPIVLGLPTPPLQPVHSPGDALDCFL